MNSVRSKVLSLKYQSFTPSGCAGIGINKFEFVAKTKLKSYKSLITFNLKVPCSSNKNKLEL